MKSKLLSGVFALLLALSLGWNLWLNGRRSSQETRIQSLERQIREVQAKAAVPVVPAPVTPPVADTPKPLAPVRPERRPTVENEPNPELESLRAKLQESAANMAKLQARTSELETEVLNVTAERARAAAAEQEARARVAELEKTVETLNAGRPDTERRLRDLEGEAARLRQRTVAAEQNSALVGQLSAELRDITRRQQVYATNILRRYREVTDMFRSLPGMVESKGNGPEVTRIQTAISMADEDVRQLNDLSARLARLEKRLPARTP